MSMRAVFFDMGGTLETYGWTPELRIQATAGIVSMLEQAGIHLNLPIMQLFDIISEGLHHYHLESLETMQELPPSRVWQEYVFSKYPVDSKKLSSIAEDLMVFIETHYYQRLMRPEVPEVLKAIRKMKLKMGLISNVNSRGLVPLCMEKYGISEYFYPVVLSSEYGRRKPDPAIFHYAARLAHVPTSACIYVGDRIARDILGAKQAGYLAAVQIKHDFDHKEPDEGAVPDQVIHDMRELIPFIENLSREDNASPSKSQTKQTGIRTILFDAGDVLYFRPQRGRYLRDFLREVGLTGKPPPHEEIRSLQHNAFQGSITQNEYRRALLGLYGITDPTLLERGSQAMNADDNHIQFFKGVHETLLALKALGFLLGIITDTANPVHVKLKWFRDAGIGHVWDSIISSQEIGIKKPAPEIYRAALDQMNLDASQAVFVGHDDDELQGARGVGIKTIAFNHGSDAEADYYIENFTDLLSVPILSKDRMDMKV